MRRPALQLAITASLLFPCGFARAQAKPCPALETNIADTKFKAGQVWSYRTRPGEPDSTLTILQIDRGAKAGIIIHVRLDGLLIHNPRGELVSSIEHMPFSRDAVLLSTIGLVRTTVQPPAMEGYNRWRADCGGIYTISVADAVSVMEKTLNTR